jgi:putative tricarboxylic transport membrane protein
VTLRGRSELLVAALVVAVGVFVLVQTAAITVPQTANVVGPKFFPTAVGAALLVVGVWLAVDVLKGGHGDPDVGEDVDLSRPSDWRTIGLLGGAFALHAALIDVAGWPVAAGVLFWGSAFALGSRRYARDAAVTVVLVAVVFTAFTRGLGLTLPAGVLGPVV